MIRNKEKWEINREWKKIKMEDRKENRKKKYQVFFIYLYHSNI
jgi:hypothetical protein